MIKCCKDCKDRHTACHSTCEKYKAEKAADDKLKAVIKKERALNYSLDCLRIRAIKRIKEEGRRH